MDVKEAIYKRRSIRFFKDDSIDQETLVELMRDAQMAPSWANSQPWRVFIATGATLQQIREEHLKRASRGVRGTAEFSTMHREEWDNKAKRNMGQWSRGIQQFLDASNGAEYPLAQNHLFNAPAIAYLTIPKNSSYWTIFDLGAFAQTLMLSAYGRGLGSMPAYETVKYSELVRRLMEIPDDQTVAMGVALGYPDEKKINSFVSEREEIETMLEIKK